MFGSIKKAMKLLEAVLKHLEPERLSRQGSLQLFECFAKLEKLAAAGKALCGLQVACTNAWYETGERSPAHYLAAKSGTTVGRAASMLNTTATVLDLPATSDAYRKGKLSQRQVEQIATAAELNRESEYSLLEIAEWEAFEALKRQCERVRFAARSESERHAYLRKHRQLHRWTDIEGAFHLKGQFTPEDGAVIWAALAPFKNTSALRDKDKEPDAAYAADALVALARSSCRVADDDPLRPGPKAMVHVRVDYAALERGALAPGEMCEIPGVGPITVAAARELATDCFLKAVVMQGQDVRWVAHLGRTIPARVKTAVMERDEGQCVVPVCVETHNLAFDHVKEFAVGGETSMKNLALLCPWHHLLKTHHQHLLGRVHGKWMWYEPDGPPRKQNPRQPELVAAAPRPG